MENSRIAAGISERLQLDIPPIGLSFVETAPADIPAWENDIPSACTLWRKAESTVFYAPAAKHFNCPIGAMVMGFELPDSIQAQLTDLVGRMCSCGYVSPDEAARIPIVKRRHAGIVYGPLKGFPMRPDLIVLWLTPRQAMLYSEADGRARWTTTSPATVLGRPACAALAIALENSNSAFSLGCTGMRTFTGIHEDRLLVALPGDKGSDLLNCLESTIRSNGAMADFYEAHKARFE